MGRKLRHPHQVMKCSELVVGEWYRFPTLFRNHTTNRDNKVLLMVGTVQDSPASALARGFTCVGKGRKIREFFDPPVCKHSTYDTYDKHVRPWMMTIHEDRWADETFYHLSSLIYWDPAGYMMGWDPTTDYLGEQEYNSIESHEAHRIVVPDAAWDADPVMHVVDWINPDTVVRPDGDRDWTSEEAAFRAKRDAAMRKAFGFD